MVYTAHNAKSRADSWSLERLGTLHNAQDGRCANPGCRHRIPIVGPRRGVDVQTGKMLCRSCLIALGLTKRQPRIIVGLLAYLGFISEESLTGVKLHRSRRSKAQ